MNKIFCQLNQQIKKSIDLLTTFIKALWFHVWAGFPKSTQQQINDRFLICKSCEYFDKVHSQCLLCGCNVNEKKIFMNKLAWADQKCPIDKWGKLV